MPNGRNKKDQKLKRIDKFVAVQSGAQRKGVPTSPTQPGTCPVEKKKVQKEGERDAGEGSCSNTLPICGDDGPRTSVSGLVADHENKQRDPASHKALTTQSTSPSTSSTLKRKLAALDDGHAEQNISVKRRTPSRAQTPRPTGTAGGSAPDEEVVGQEDSAPNHTSSSSNQEEENAAIAPLQIETFLQAGAGGAAVGNSPDDFHLLVCRVFLPGLL